MCRLCTISQCREAAIPFSTQLPSWRRYVIASHGGSRRFYDQTDGVHEDFRFVECDRNLVGAISVLAWHYL
ncbi:MAG: hypothetical protein ACK559_36600, partial [bacterium]